MAKITIDGKECQFEGKKMILQVALDNGVELPHYCYHPGLSIVASCRICLAEVAAPNPRNDNKLELIPKLMPTCQTPAVDGQVVDTLSPKSIANQKAVMEYLLLNHPLDCPVCDQAGECSLQDYSFKYGRGQSRFQEAKTKQPTKNIGTHVKLYSDRCIMCTRCVRFTKEVSGSGELGVFGRGHTEQIDVFPGRPLNNELSGNVVDICPVGALLDKDFLFTQRVWFLSSTPSIDGITSSGHNIHVHHNEGRVYRIKPRYNAGLNKWWISDEIRYGWKFVHSEDRLSKPMRQQLGTQVETDWSKAYEDARDGIRKAVAEGGEGTLAVMVSPMLSSEESYLLGKLARGIDAKAVLAVGPVPTDGQDKTFKGGYTVYAEKAPNARGVRRALELVAGDAEQVVDFNTLVSKLADKASKIGAVILTGNYPSAWTTKELTGSLRKPFVVLIDTLPTDLSAKANVLLPGATWLEKAGSFENAGNVLQAFEQAIPVMELCKPEGQIALDLAAVFGLRDRAMYNPEYIREEMGGIFTTDVKFPSLEAEPEPDLEYVEL